MDTIENTARAIREGRSTAEEAVGSALHAIETYDPRIRAFLQCSRERALEKAGAIDGAIAGGESVGPLAGVPIALKDNICTAWGKTTCASRILGSFRPAYDAHVVQRLEEAGAIIVGKTNLDEFAMGSSTETGAEHPTFNPWDTSRVPGGSSGGSTAAVAARLVPGALGSSTGGSIRQPASFCGVTGLKPSYGRVSRYGLAAYASSLDQIGPIAVDVRDVAILMNVIAGHDRRDSTSVKRDVPDYVAAIERYSKDNLCSPLGGVRVGMAPEYFGDGLDEGVRAAVEAGIAVLRGQGAEVVEIELPHLAYAIACYYIIAPAEASSNLARYDGLSLGRRMDKPADVMDAYCGSRGEGLGAEVKRRIMIGTFVLSSGYYEAYYLTALKVRTLIKRDFDEAFSRVDVIASPVAPTTAFRIAEKIDDPLAMYLGDIYTISANLAGICAMSVPCGFDAASLPIGMQLMGPSFGEEQLLAVAHQYQLHTDHHEQAPPDCGVV